MEWLTDPQVWLALVTLTALEIVLGIDMHIPKGYIYFAMAFSVMVEMLNLRMRRGTPVKLHQPHLEESINGKRGVTDV